MNWLGTLSPLVAVVVLFVWALKHDKRSSLDTIQTISKCFVEPLQNGIQTSMDSLKVLVQNHFQHDLEERLEDRTERQRMRIAIEELTRQLKIVNGKPKP